MSIYAQDHADARQQIIDAGGVAVTFSATAKVQNAATRTVSDGATTTVPGVAVRVRGDPKQYEALGLVEREPVTLLFATDAFGDAVPLPASAVWNGVTLQVAKVYPTAPDGPPIISRVVLAS